LVTIILKRCNLEPHFNHLKAEIERERGERKWGGSERHYIWGAGQETIYPILKVPRQCPLILLVEVMHMMGINFF
jgi:hypothetical protein